MREFEQVISRGNIVDKIAELLYATGAVHDNEEVTNIQFNNLVGSDTEFVTMKVFAKSERKNTSVAVQASLAKLRKSKKGMEVSK